MKRAIQFLKKIQRRNDRRQAFFGALDDGETRVNRDLSRTPQQLVGVVQATHMQELGVPVPMIVCTGSRDSA